MAKGIMYLVKRDIQSDKTGASFGVGDSISAEELRKHFTASVLNIWETSGVLESTGGVLSKKTAKHSTKKRLPREKKA